MSEEYFTNQVDRYMSFVNGGGGLVDFYAELCDILCKCAIKYDKAMLYHGSNLPSLFDNESARKLELEASLMGLFNGDNRDCRSNSKLNFHSDATITRNLLRVVRIARIW